MSSRDGHRRNSLKQGTHKQLPFLTQECKMNTWSLTGDRQDRWLGRTVYAAPVRMGLKSSPEAAPKLVLWPST